MLIKFPEEDDLAHFKDDIALYYHLIDKYLHLQKCRTNCEIFYWRGLLLFFTISLFLFLLQKIEVISWAFYGTSLIGLGISLAVLYNFKKDAEWHLKTLAYCETGSSIERKHQFSTELFKVFRNQTSHSVTGEILNRLFPVVLLYLAIIISIFLLNLQIRSWAMSFFVISQTLGFCLLRGHFIRLRKKIIDFDKQLLASSS